METTTTRPRFLLRAMTSVLTAASFLVVLVSGVVLFVAPSGRVARDINWRVWTLDKHGWGDLHICFSAVFLLCVAGHLLFNYRPLLHYFRNRETRRIGFRWEWLGAVALSAMMIVGVRANVPPFSSLLQWRSQVKPGGGCGEEKGEVRGGSGAEQGMPRGHSGGGGMGWKTLADFCREEKIPFADAQARLTAKGIAAAGTQTLREIADANQLDRPTTVADVVRGKPR